MGSKDGKGLGSSGVARPGSPEGEVPEPALPEQLARELRELHDSYGTGGDIPEHLIELARQVADAHARLDLEGAAGVPQDPEKQRGH